MSTITPASSTYLNQLRARIDAGDHVAVYDELYSLGYSYAGWASGVAKENTVAGVAANQFMIATHGDALNYQVVDA